LKSWACSHRNPQWAQAEDQLEREVSRYFEPMPFPWLAVPTMADGGSDRGTIERTASPC
jgi:hypothetical protein